MMFSKVNHVQWLRVALAVLLGLGLIFRLVNLDRKVFWVDEVATAIRVAGYTKTEVTEALADGSLHTPQELLHYQKLSSERSLSNAIQAFQQSPEHAPLYFLLVRGWTQLFGSSVVALRSFSVVCSLLLLIVAYGVSQLLFASVNTSWIAVGLMAISPFFIAYAQEARPYSLWLLTLMLNGGMLLHALRHNTLAHWGLYVCTLISALYTSLLTLPILAGQALYVVCEQGLKQSARRFGIAVIAAIVALLPWLWLIGQQWQTLQTNTTWMRLPLDGIAKATVWFYSIAILYFDVPVITQPRIVAAAEITIATGVVAVIVYAFYLLWQQTAQRVWLFVGTLSLSVPFALIVADLISNGRYSSAPRYLLPFHLGAQLAVAYLLKERLLNPNQSRKWQGVALFLVMMSLLSNFVHVEASPRYLKNRNIHNFSISEIINQSNQPLVLAEDQNTLDLMSLSHTLNSDTQIKILPTVALLRQFNADSLAVPKSFPNQCQDIFLVNPSVELLQHASRFSLEERYHPTKLVATEFSLALWQIKLSNSAC